LKVWKKVACPSCHGDPPRREVKCKKCNGSGIHISKNEIGFCWSCGGSRTVSRS
jgi:molecular chaperone DnaJ